MSSPSSSPAKWLGAVATALLLSGCAEDPADLPNVLLISVDSLRADHVSAYGYRSPFAAPGDHTTPAIEKLAAEGVRFDTAISTTSWTLPSHMALFTGLNDSLHGVVHNARSLDPAIDTLAELLKERGYQTGGFFTGPNLHPAFGFGSGFDVYENATGEELPEELFARTTTEENALSKIHNRSHHGLTSPRVTKLGSEWLAQAAKQDAPFFLFMHYWDPHYNYEAPADYGERFDAQYAGETDPTQFIYSRDIKSPRDMQHVLAMYDAEIRFTDDHIAFLLDQLDALDLTEETLVVFTADHGDEFYEHGKKGHQRNFFNESVHIPLVMRFPGRLPQGAVVDSLARIQDVMPTICELLDIAPPAYLTGTSLVEVIEGGAGPPAQALELALPRRDVHLSGLRNEDMLVVWDRVAGQGEYYDLRIDPRELKPFAFTDLETSDKLPVRMLREQLAELEVKRLELPRTPGHGDLDALPDDLAEGLDKAGYMGSLDHLDDEVAPEGLYPADGAAAEADDDRR